MSGDFVQRGAPALMEKYLRAEMALLGGADLVLELPIQVSTASAEGFAAGGVSLLDGLGCVDELCFGSECGDTEILMETARILVAEPPVYRDFLQKNLRDGMSFPLARSRALTSYVAKSAISDVSSGDGHFIFPEQMDSILSSPNNILGIEYCKALLRQNSSIRPMRFSEKEVGITMRISRMFPEIFSRLLPVSGNFFPPKRTPWFSRFIPAAAFPVFSSALKKGCMLSETTLDLPLHYKLLLETEETLRQYPDLSDALIRRILKYRNQYESFSQFADLLKTRDVTRLRHLPWSCPDLS